MNWWTINPYEVFVDDNLCLSCLSQNDKEIMNCGWSNASVKYGQETAPKWNQITKKDFKIHRNNGELPESFKGKDVSSSTNRELILYTYENYGAELKKELESVNEIIKTSSELNSLNYSSGWVLKPGQQDGFPVLSQSPETPELKRFLEESKKEGEEMQKQNIKKRERV